MNRSTRDRLNAVLLAIALVLMLSPLLLSHLDWLENADLLVKLAVLPGGPIFGGLVFLLNGCIEHYADILPQSLRSRESQVDQWLERYQHSEMDNVTEFLEWFAISQGFRAVDAFQFRPQDRVCDLLRDFFPEKGEPLNCPFDDEDEKLGRSWRENATLHELVDVLLMQSKPQSEISPARTWWKWIASSLGFIILGVILLGVLVALMRS